LVAWLVVLILSDISLTLGCLFSCTITGQASLTRFIVTCIASIIFAKDKYFS